MYAVVYHCKTVRLHTDTHGEAWTGMGRYGQTATDMDRYEHAGTDMDRHG
jgi:hypothetical protein